MKIAWLFSVFMMWLPVVGMADIVRQGGGSNDWVADKICAEMDPNDEMYCLCNKDYGIEPPVITGYATTDRRTYVSDKDWQSKFPYKHILAVVNDDGAFCTANMVRGKIVTAAHCVNDYGLKRGDQFTVQDAYGQRITATLEESRYDDGIPGHDWAILQPDTDLSNVSISEISIWPIQNTGNKQIYLSGFGVLKIMNDAEIQRFQNAYVEFLKAFYSNEQQYIDNAASAGVRLSRNDVEATMGKAFINDLKRSNICRQADQRGFRSSLCDGTQRENLTGFNYAACGLEYNDIFSDSDRMKSSINNAANARASYINEGKIIVEKCQSWGGNSGGGFYLSDGSIVGVFGANIPQVGGDGHAGGYGIGTLMYTFEDKLPAVNPGNDDPGNDNPDNDDSPGDDNPGVEDNPGGDDVSGNDRSNDLPKLLSWCKDEDLPDNAISGHYWADVHSDKKCLGAKGGEVGCTCGANECAENYRKVGSAKDSRCVLVNSSDLGDDNDKKLVDDVTKGPSTGDNGAGSGGGTGSGQTKGTSSNPTEAVVGGECLSEHLPMGATRGIYITYGNNIYTCRGNKKCACAAMECDTDAGYTLVRDARGNNMGWCRKQQRR